MWEIFYSFNPGLSSVGKVHFLHEVVHSPFFHMLMQAIFIF